MALGTGDFLLNSGTLRAGGPTRDINVGGNYVQTGGELALRIGGSAIGQYDRLSVLGSASLAGRLRVDSINGFQPVSDDRFILVNANGGRTGVFSEFDDNLDDTALQPTLTYTANQVILEYLQSAFLPFALTPNQTAVARTLDVVVNDSGAADLIAFLDTIPVTSLPAAFDLIAPEEIGTIFEITRSAAKAQAFHVQRRLDEIHAFVPAPPEEHFSKDGKTVMDGKTSKEVKHFVLPEPRWGLWATGSGEFVTVGDTFNARGYDFESGGITLGLDYKFSDHFAAGVLFNYTRTEADLTGGGDMNVDAVRGGIYASVFGGGAYLNAYVGGGYFDFDSHRAGLEGRVRGETDGGEFNALVAAGYDWHFGNLTIGPIASYQYTYTSYSSFNEEGSLAPLRIGATNGESSRTNVGLRCKLYVPGRQRDLHAGNPRHVAARVWRLGDRDQSALRLWRTGIQRAQRRSRRRQRARHGGFLGSVLADRLRLRLLRRRAWPRKLRGAQRVRRRPRELLETIGSPTVSLHSPARDYKFRLLWRARRLRPGFRILF
jgi:hypothetical protein